MSVEDPVEVVNQQAEDEALWFDAERITEHILQNALRRLHAAVEGEEPPAFVVRGKFAE